MLTSNPNLRLTRPKLLDSNIVAGNLLQRTSYRNLDMRADDTPERIIELLISGNQQFVEMRAQNIEYNSLSLSAAAQGKTPSVAILNYARLPTAIENIFGHKFSEIFAIDSSQQFPSLQEISALEYAVLFLGVKAIVILDEASDPAVANDDAATAARGRQIELATRHHPRLRICERLYIEPVTYQRARLDRLKTSPLLSQFIETGKLKIICATYDVERETVKPIA
jgi:carbonic anhydrase